jgi:hypothetical protein
MDCRNFKEMLDSFLSGELLVETNHSVLRHLELCDACRAELAARRRLRASLRSAYLKETMGVDGHARLRERLRAEARRGGMAGVKKPSILARLFSMRLRLAAGAAIIALVIGGAYNLSRLSQRSIYAAELSSTLISQAAGDHDHCAPQFADNEQPEGMDEAATKYDPAYADLDKIAEVGAQGMRLHAAHICSFGGRNFAHLVYTRGSQLISLMVTERDALAMRQGVAPQDDGLRAGLQQALRDRYTVSAYQTAKRVVLVVSELPGTENRALAERVAAPICERLRRVEAYSSERQAQRRLLHSLMASLGHLSDPMND